MKQREKEFQAALKVAARSHGWRYAGGGFFREDGEWFASVLPFLHWERGATIHFSLKPLKLDLLFWDIVGLPENKNLPLSFRANGAWVLRPPPKDYRVGPAVSEVRALAELVASSANDELEQSRDSRSIDQMLNELMASGRVRGQRRALVVCLHILKDDLDSALALCREGMRSDISDAGGFITSNADGTALTFVHQAEAWIISKRRGSLRLV